MIEQISEFDNLVILRPMTKSFGLAGLRVGYGVCNPTLAKKLSANKIPWNVNGLAQVAGVYALSDKDFYQKQGRLSKKSESFCMIILENLNRLAH